jgi:hypothetical protein
MEITVVEKKGENKMYLGFDECSFKHHELGHTEAEVKKDLH